MKLAIVDHCVRREDPRGHTGSIHGLAPWTWLDWHREARAVAKPRLQARIRLGTQHHAVVAMASVAGRSWWHRWNRLGPSQLVSCAGDDGSGRASRTEKVQRRSGLNKPFAAVHVDKRLSMLAASAVLLSHEQGRLQVVCCLHPSSCYTAGLYTYVGGMAVCWQCLAGALSERAAITGKRPNATS
jgi:hypothetical protein